MGRFCRRFIPCLVSFLIKLARWWWHFLLIPRHREKSPVLLCEFKTSLVYSENCPRETLYQREREKEKEKERERERERERREERERERQRQREREDDV